jgi:hypothetical protein
MALQRAPRAVRHLVSGTAAEPAVTPAAAPVAVGTAAAPLDDAAFLREVGRMRWVELLAVGRGVLRYGRSRRTVRARERTANR